jgi:undecaprenyl-diphosphatase
VNWVADALLSLPTWAALIVVFAFPALEASAFVGIVFPGEIAVILGGVIASQGDLPLAAVLVAASSGAVIGDSVGYAIGRRYGRSLLARLPKRIVKPEHVDRAVAVINRLGGRAVFIGRFTAALRVLVPGLCGIAEMRYRTFLLWNFLGGVMWACGAVMLGYLAGAGYKTIEHRVSLGGYALLGLIVVAGLVLWLRRRRRERRESID